MFLFLTSCNDDTVQFKTHFFQISVGKQGYIKSLYDRKKHQDYLIEKPASPLLSIRVNGKIIAPVSATWNKTNKEMILIYPPGDSFKAVVKVEEKKSHINFELVSIDPADSIDLVIWGPFQTSINRSIGETVGVARGDKFAIGLQALNPQTLGGYPWQENDCMPQIDIFENGNYNDISEKGKRQVLYRVEAAKPTDTGSSLQAYCRNRNQERIISNWRHKTYPAPPFADGGIIGSKIALFGCPVENTLETIGQIELKENLPHPLLNGHWAKTAREATSAYLIYPFGEDDIDQAIQLTNQAGLKYLYHPGPFKTWGHFVLNDQFPHGISGLKSCVEKAEKQGLHVGIHTLSNFITPNDAYVTPVPDSRLAKAGRSSLSEKVNSTREEIPVESPNVFRAIENNHLKTI